MYKNKDGKVIASLTEVKNKTGDIFAVVDKFGEISLTSYNKVRYKILKVDIENTVDINEDGPEVKIATSEKKSKTAPKIELEKGPKVQAKKEEVITEEPKIEEPAEVKLFEKTIDLKIWDRENRAERQFSLNALKPLIS